MQGIKATIFFTFANQKSSRKKIPLLFLRYPSSDTPTLLPSTAPSTAFYCLHLSHFLSFVTHRTGTKPETRNPPAVTSTTKPLTGSKPTEIVKLIYALYNSTTQINVYWYVRGKHFDFWQATTEQGKPGYFTTVRRRRFPSREGKREGKRRALLDGKPLL